MRYNLKLKEIKKVKLGKSIKEHAGGSIYRMNASSADCYAFSYDTLGQKYLNGTVCKKVDFSGGWDWSNGLVDDSATHLYFMETGKFYQIID